MNPMGDDAELLSQYIRAGSEPAFRELVNRHIGLVQATASRVLAGDAHAAQDVTQMVFTDLARKAASLPSGVLLGGWLHQHAYFLACNIVRAETRRRARERTAMEINAVNDAPSNDIYWQQLAPVLDAALHDLDREDREAIVLRYLQQQDVRHVGLALGTSENTAQKRLGRALEKLRAILTQRGVTVSTVLLSTALDAGAATAPVSTGLAASVSASALNGAAAVTSVTLLTSTLKIMTASKLTLSLAALVVIAATTLFVVHNKSASGSRVMDGNARATPVASAPITPSKTAAVETPKAAPAPAGGKVSASESLTVTAPAGSLSFNGTSLGNTKLRQWTYAENASGPGAPSTTPNTASTSNPTGRFSDWTSIIADERSQLEQTRQLDAQIIAHNTETANGDPAQLAKVAALQQQYDSQLLTQQKKIDTLETDPAAQAAYLANLQSKMAEVKKNLARSVTLATAQAKDDPAMLAKIEASRQRTEAQLQEQQQAIDRLSANLSSANPSSSQAAIIAAKRADLEKFKTTSQQVLAQAIAQANGDPAALAKTEAARLQYENYAQQQQAAIDALEAQTAP